MNMSDNESEIYLDGYEYGSGCDEDTNTDVPNKHMVMLVLYYVLFCLGLLGNSTVLWVLLRHIKVKTMTDVCLLNLVVSDLLLAVSLPLWAYSSQNLVSCKLITGVYQLGFYSGTLFVTLMSVDRYLAIVHAVAAIQKRTLRYGIIASVITWVISVVMASPQVIFASLERSTTDSHCTPIYPEDNQVFWKLRQNFSENTVGLFVCLPIIVFCYVKILVVLSKCRNSKKNRAVKLIFTIVCVFVVCWVPYNVVVFLQTLEQLGVLNNCNVSTAISSAMGFAEIIALSHCCINPVVYAFVGEKFRKSLARVLCKYLSLSYSARVNVSQGDTTEKETSHTPVRSEY